MYINNLFQPDKFIHKGHSFSGLISENDTALLNNPNINDKMLINIVKVIKITDFCTFKNSKMVRPTVD